jgi:signal transduction histidine kinase
LKAPIPSAGDRLIYDAVHEFNTPLTVIREFASILSEGLCAPGIVTSEECLSAIRGASGDLVDMLDSFRGIASLLSEDGRPERAPCSLSAIWGQVLPTVAPRAADRGVRLEADISPEVLLDVDPRQVARALRCVVRSAIRATPVGGSVRCWARRRSQARVVFGCLDEGPDLSQDDVRLFRLGEVGEGFERRSRICTFGLDLELARVVAERNGGRMHFRRGPAGGRACLLVLPVARPNADAGRKRRSRKPARSLEGS